MITAFVLSVLGLIGFVASMCVVVYLFWRRPKGQAPVADGYYRLRTVGRSIRTGEPVCDFEWLDTPEDIEGVKDQVAREMVMEKK